MSKNRTNNTPSVDNISQYDLAYALPGAFASLASEGDWQYARHLEYIEDKLVQIHHKPLRLLISVPPQHGKSWLCSVAFPAWYLGHYPKQSVMLLTYQAEYSQSLGKKSRAMFKEHAPKVFGVEASQEARRVDSWETTRGGVMNSIGIGGAITGKSASGLLIVDDYVKGREEAMNPKILDEKWDAFWSDVYSRLSPWASIVIIGTRWSDEDIIGRLKRQMKNPNQQHLVEQFEEVRLPALCDDPDNDPLGREMDEPLVDNPKWPYYRTKEQWEKIKANTPPFWWESLYQQRPAPRTGNLVKIDWFRYYKELPEDPDLVIISWDTANKDKELSDYTVAGVWYMKDNKFYLVDVRRDRVSHPRLLEMMSELDEIWNPHTHVIEEAGSGISLIQHIEDQGNMNYIPMVPDRNKEIRMDAESLAIQSGRVLLPDTAHYAAPWLEDYLEEMRLFPNSLFDDQADMTSQALKFFRERLDREPFDVF